MKMTDELLPRNARILCAVSGGADSMALLHGLYAGGYDVAAAHFEHGLRGEEALRDAEFVEAWCRERSIPCLVEHGDVSGYAREHGLGLEEAARELRYAFLERAADALGCACIATAHTADDNVETLLMHLLRGSGTAGLGGIPPRRGRIVRPLLGVTRAEIERYLARNAVPHVEDSTNAADCYTRNRLRHHIVPALRDFNPALTEALGRTAALLGRDEDCLSREAARFLRRHFDGESLPLNALNSLHPAVASRVIRQLWPESLSFEQTESVLRFCQGTQLGFLDLPGGRLRREQGRLYRGAAPDTPDLPPREISAGQTVAIPEIGLALSCERTTKSQEINDLFKTYDLKYETIRGKLICTGRRSGDRFHPAGRGCGKTLKALFTERGLTQAERRRVLVLRDEGGIVAVSGFGVDERCRARVGDAILRIILTEG